MRLGKGKRRRQAQRRGMPNWAKATLAIGGALTAFGVVLAAILVIALPPYFRSLEPYDQQRVIHWFPLATYWMPTRAFDELPTLSGASGDSDAAQNLLMTPLSEDAETTPSALSAPDSADDPLSQGQDPAPPVSATALTPAPSPTDGGIPIGQVPTDGPTPLPTYVAPTQAVVEPTWTPMIAPTTIPVPAAYRLYDIRYEQQGWNNCGPTTMTMALSYFGYGDDQYTAASWMKPNKEDKNVSPWQMVRYVNEMTGLKAIYRIGGTTTLLKRLLSAGFPVVIEKGFQPAGEEWMGHYLLLMGYDDSQGHFLAYDSYLGYDNGNGKKHPYSVFDENWRNFNRTFIVVYEQSREMQLREVLGNYADPKYGYQVALEMAREEASRNREDRWAWFNMGSALALLGEYENAAIAFDKAIQLRLPWRMLWYQFGPYEAYFHVGRYDDVLTLAETNRNITAYVEETYYWEGMAYAALGQQQQALQSFDRALYYNKNFYPAQEAKAQVQSGTFVANTHQ